MAFTVVAASAVPIGIFDTPADQSTGLQGSVAVSGWALDDIEIDRVELWRDVASGETTPPVSSPGDPRNGKISSRTPRSSTARGPMLKRSLEPILAAIGPAGAT